MREYPNVWPDEGLFAFSGVDGPTSHPEPFVGEGLVKQLGWLFWLTPAVRLAVVANGEPLAFLRTPEAYCLPDCWEAVFRSGDTEVEVRGAFLDRRSFTMQFAPRSGSALPALAFEPVEGEAGFDSGATTYAGEGWWLAWKLEGARASVAISYQTLDDAIDGCMQAMTADLDAALAARRAFCDAVAVPESLHDNRARVYRKAAAVQKVNVESAQGDIPVPWTTPDRMPHRHMWLWDSAFHAVGLAYLDPPLAESAIAALFAKQVDDGRIPLEAHPGSPPDRYDRSQPPIIAWAMDKVLAVTGRCAFPERVYDNVIRYLEWFENNRKLDSGLYAWQVRTRISPLGGRCGESGMDNCSRFDQAGERLAATDLCSYMASEYRCMTRLALALGKERDAEMWAERHAAVCQRVNAVMWDDETRLYFDYEDDFVRVKAASSLLPLLGGIPDRDRAEALRQHLVDVHSFATPVPVPSVAREEPTWSTDMWRGPTWMNVNLLIYDGLCQYGFLEEARRLARRTMDEIVRWYAQSGCTYEYYDSLGETHPRDLNRKGPAEKARAKRYGVIADYNWTAAVYIYLANQTGR